MTALRAGMKVVCVNASDAFSSIPGAGSTVSSYLREGTIYTIRAVGRHPHVGQGHLVWLVEVRRPILAGDGGLEQGFRPERFRPVAERKTSIEVFQKMLVPTKQKEPVNV